VPAAVSTPSSNGVTPIAPPAIAPASETVEITTDVYRLIFDLNGAQLIRAELLKFAGKDDPSQPTVLLQQDAEGTYVVQTGIVGAPEGKTYPTHLTPFKFVSSETTLTGETLPVQFVGESDGVRVTKTFTLRRDSYAIEVNHQVENLSDQMISPSLYLQMTRECEDH
jgi:YidC/Oxa1 family membrane protein insertase